MMRAVLLCRKRAAKGVGLFVAFAFFIGDLNVFCAAEIALGIVGAV